MFWAQARQQGQPTADDKARDGDVILAAQAITLGVTDVVMATTHVGHLSRLAPAASWPDITATSLRHGSKGRDEGWTLEPNKAVQRQDQAPQ